MSDSKLKKIRKYLKFSQYEFAENLELSYHTYTSYERGDRKLSFEVLEKLAKKYNINLNWLIADIGEMLNPPTFEQVEDVLTQKVEAILKNKGLIQ